MKDPDTTGATGSGQSGASLVWLARMAIRCWAILGGFLVIAIVLMTTASVISGFVFDKPFPGDFELVELGVAVAAFSFLPFCQLTGSNVTVDIFTAWASPRLVDGFKLISSLIAGAFALLLTTTMYDGMEYYRQYNEVTPILEVPIWSVFPPILISLVLLAVASLISLMEAILGLMHPTPQSL
ncbi:TRAP-type C4-dicarboxylate transport system permease small subunit [Breoghania corrubedonensis]|uniref:TRAP transporter small permease protein n=1 Tax=Breoghania corrubedonensis TaxID=665038 RepID=A0A2T5VB40_9HYPH|nr:TRAP transporter small permease [Breoghania corrubedonensis]PTW60972.1 TRAP-type C4-dicarboxylate transport system permease small subunit [Breoghania corrubedonensis]